MTDVAAAAGDTAAGPAGTPTSSFVGGYAPGQTADFTAPDKPAEPDAAKPEPAKTEPKEDLAAIIRQNRQDREARQRAEQSHKETATRVAALEAELQKVKTQDDPLSDPASWAKARGYTKEQQALLGQTLLYDLVPDKAPPDLRIKLFEARHARETSAKEAARVEAERAAQAKATEQQLANYAATLTGAAQSFTAGSHPESEAWFGEDKATYARSLLATANNLAEVAQKTGKVADLSPAAVAAVLEAEIAGRMRARDARAASAQRKQSTEGEAQVSGKQPASGETTSTRGLGAGPPRSRAQTDAERIQRAIEAGFRTR